MSTNLPYDAMDRDELVRLAGEQALLKKEITGMSAEHQRDLTALRNLPNEVGRSKGWLPGAQALLQRLADREQEMAHAQQRLAEYRKLTGID